MTRDYATHPSLHDWENWQESNGINGYTWGSKHATGVATYFNQSRHDMGRHTVYSGGALRRVEEYNGTPALDVLNYHSNSGHSFSRLDLALDFINTGVTVEDFQNCYLNGEADTRIKSATTTKSLTHKGETLYIGSMKRKKKLVRMYDKASEQKLTGDWVRVETQIMGKPATASAKAISTSENYGKTAIGVMKDVCDFKTVKQWSDVTMNAEKVEIGTISSEKGDTRDWLLNQCIPALAKEVKARS